MNERTVNLAKAVLAGFHQLQLAAEDLELALREMSADEVEKLEASIVQERTLAQHWGRDFFEQLAGVAEVKGLEKTALLYRRCRSLISPTVIDRASGMQETIQGIEEGLIKKLDEQLHEGTSMEAHVEMTAQLTIPQLKLAVETAEKLECWRAAKWYRDVIKTRE